MKQNRKTKPAKRGEREHLPRSKAGSQNAQWFGPEVRRWFILIGLSIVVSLLLFPNLLTKPKLYKLGDVADRDIKASREYLIENTDLSEKDRQAAVKEVLPVYDFDPTAANVVPRIKEAFQTGRVYLEQSTEEAQVSGQSPSRPEKSPKDPSTNLDAAKRRFFETLDAPSDDETFETLLTYGFPGEEEELIIRPLSQVMKIGVVSNKEMLMRHSGKGVILQDIVTQNEAKIIDLDRFYDPAGATNFIKKQIERLRKSTLVDELSNLPAVLATSLVKPNITFNKRETELRKDLARKSVKPVYFRVKKGEMLVREGERITSEHLLKLSEQYKFLKRKEILGQVPGMAVLIGFLVSAVYVIGLMTKQSSRSEAKDLLFCATTLLTFFLMVFASRFVAEEIARGFNYFTPRALLFVVPVASGAMLISIFQGINASVSFSLLVSVFASLLLGGRMEFFLYFFISSLVAAYGVKHCRERGVFIKTALRVGLTNVIMALCIEALHGSFYSFEAVIAAAAAFIGGILVGVIATGILPLIEMSFGYTTDIKLLELANLDQPLIRDLMVQAPGTYHHSVIVSNMVEASAEAVNANPLLAKVAAYYHDIGKIKKPLYFIENQLGEENKHEKLAPSMSALILISHVKDGVELARKHKLGAEIADIIPQHHGTKLITYFYQKAKEQTEKKGDKSSQVREEVFRYPGPKPQTKEAGLVMLADVVEAASRTLVNPTAARIQGVVQKMINNLFSDGQLEDCELTLKDLHEIAKSFNKTLSGIFHQRVEYPEPVAKTSAARKGGNGNPDQVGAEDPWAKKPEDKTENGESLRRLGLS